MLESLQRLPASLQLKGARSEVATPPKPGEDSVESFDLCGPSTYLGAMQPWQALRSVKPYLPRLKEADFDSHFGRCRSMAPGERYSLR